MRHRRRPIVIASRRSELARVQAQGIGAALARRHGVEVTYEWITSEADRRADAVLADIGGKGLFTRAIDAAVLGGRADVAVHSMKDVPAAEIGPAPGLTIAAVPRREDVRDCLISGCHAAAISDLSVGATLGTSSPRRAAQALRLRPDLKIVRLRGNVGTRIEQVVNSESRAADEAVARGERTAPEHPLATHNSPLATLLALAGLKRLGLKQHASHPLDPSSMLAAAGQGALAVVCRADDHEALLRCLPLNHPPSAEAVHAERAVVARLGADCFSPVAVLVESQDNRWRLRARVLLPDGTAMAQADLTRDLRSGSGLTRLVNDAVGELERQGARAMLEAASEGLVAD